MFTRRQALAGLSLSLTAPSLAVRAAPMVQRDVRLICPYAPGGTVDILGRLLAEAISPRLGGRNVVVENRSGAGTFIAMQAAANAADGYTMSMSSTATLATTPVLPGAMAPIDVDKALTNVTSLIRVPMLLVGQPSASFRTVSELVAYAKANPGKLNIGNSGQGGQTHLLAARLMHEAGISMEQIQYRGGIPALTDIMAGNSDLYFSLLPESLPFVRDGRLRAIAFASEQRNHNLPDVPLIRETIAGFTGDVGYGMVMAAGTPNEWVQFWNEEINRAMNLPEVKARLESRFLVATNGTPAAYTAEIMEDRRVWGAVIQAAGIRAGA
ncbi:tripartite tricarboxylate transporter substrate binding protein [Rhodovarius crocodyli]|uniref:Tripartite tricarboxylate transporter substrate binding protein n=1 Tax=Rhodovarius crocodyli TaxID=1979269 RepID=A0A437MJ06_9PROT|nr:tripartite tricarboxylate transporter substrate binding protein [Rhodovarius crocodyli]RVT97606.1 tripartite tricarboxylate transporter substrate binding protein [Rhodovarius crocodyli]